MLGIKTITGFKIGGSVAIIILLLGIAVLFGTYQMSKVNQEVIQISEQYVPLHEIISDVRIHQVNQANSLEKTLRFYNNANTFGYDHSIDEFWASGGIFESNISRAKIVETEFALPPYEEQIRIVNQIEDVFELLDNLHM